MENKILIFDTNIWIELLKNKNSKKRYNVDYFEELKENFSIGIFNMSIIEYLMRFKRKNNLDKIREIINYIKINNFSIGQITSPNFNDFPKNYDYLLNLDDNDLIIEIDKLQRKRLSFKSDVISMWIMSLIEIIFINIISEPNEIGDLFVEINKQFVNVKKELYDYFILMEEKDENKKNICKIFNDIYINVFFSVNIEKFRYSKKIYDDICFEINNLKSNQSISYLYKGVYSTEFMNIYKKRLNRSLDKYYNNNFFKDIFYERLECFMQNEPLQKNDVEDMLMLSMLEKNNNIIIVTKDKKMKLFMKKINKDYSEEICNKLFDIN